MQQERISCKERIYVMKKKTILFALCFMCVGLISCGTVSEGSGSQQTTSSSASEAAQTTAAPTEQTEAAPTEQTEAAPTDKADETSAPQSENQAEALTKEQALNAIKNYCFNKNPDLKNMVDSPEYNIYWDVSTNEAGEIVVLYRSYTGAQIRYYIEPVSGEAYVTELVPGIIDEEKRTEERLNARDYLA